MKTLIGIDLGTTNTVAAINGTVAEASGDESGPFLPSVVAFLPNEKRLVGRAARRRLAIDPKNTIASSKRLIGRMAQSGDANTFRSRYSYEIVAGESGQACFETRSGPIDPGEVAAHVIGRKLSDMELLPGSVRAIVTVPTMFREAQREATRQACRLAGVADVQTVLEPVATAHAYLHGQSSKSGTFAVYDLGGGTFDMAVVKCTSEGLEVLAHGGDLYLGGDDIDRDLAEWVRGQLLEQQYWDVKTSVAAYARLIEGCEAAKIRLAFSHEGQIDLTQVDPSAPFLERNITITRDQLGQVSSALVGRTFVICDEVLHRAKLRTGDIDGVFLAGGSTQNTLVREGVSAYFGKEPNSDHDPMEVIAIGSSLIAQNHSFAI